MSFPLYETIYHRVRTKVLDLTHDEKQFVVDNIKTLELNEHEIIYALIRTYQSKYNNLNSYIIPYNGKYLKKGIKFDLEKFPHTLKHILHDFIQTHLQSTLTIE